MLIRNTTFTSIKSSFLLLLKYFRSFDINIFYFLATYNQRADDVSSMLNEELSRLMHESQNCLSYTLRMYSSFTVIFNYNSLFYEHSNVLECLCIYMNIGRFDPCPRSSPKKQCDCGGCYYQQRLLKVRKCKFE